MFIFRIFLHFQVAVRRARPSRLSAPSTSVTNVQEEILELKEKILKQGQEIKKLNKLVEHYKNIAERRGRNLKKINQQRYRQKKKLANFDTIIMELKTNLNMDEGKIEILSTMSGKNNDILKRYALKEKNISVPREYSKELKKFAVTLHFLSQRLMNT